MSWQHFSILKYVCFLGNFELNVYFKFDVALFSPEAFR